ncbi:MAG: S4 domain-containing protein [bacterium]
MNKRDSRNPNGHETSASENVWHPRKMQGVARSITKAGYASRPQAEAMVEAGRVRVDGQLVTDPGTPVGPNNTISLDGQPLLEINRRYFAFHKPIKTVTSTSDRGGRRHVKEFFPSEIPGLRPAGRLDANTSGLILVSNDHIWNSFAASSTGLEKEYFIQIHGQLREVEISIITAGVHLPKLGFIRPTLLEVINADQASTDLKLVVVDGKNRQVRRIFSSLRHDVSILRRVRIGPVKLGSLPSGRLRGLTPDEITGIREP